MAMNPAVIIVIAVPSSIFGILAVAILSLSPAIRIRARPKPNADVIENTRVSIKLKSFRTLMMHTPNIAQLVVIRGRNIHNPL